MNKTQIYEWVQKLKNGVENVEEARQRGRHIGVRTPEMIAAVDLVRENRRIAISEIAMEMKIVLVLHTPSLQRSCITEKFVHGGFPGVLTQEIKNDDGMRVLCFSNGSSCKERIFWSA